MQVNVHLASVSIVCVIVSLLVLVSPTVELMNGALL